MTNDIRFSEMKRDRFMCTRLLLFISMLILGVPGMAHNGTSHDDLSAAVDVEPKLQRTWNIRGSDYFPDITLVNQDGKIITPRHLEMSN